MAGAGLRQADQHAQQGRLADAGGADDGHERAARNRQVEAAQHLGATAVALEGEREA